MIASTGASALDGKIAFEGTICATLGRKGIEATHFLFTRKGNRIRIENTINRFEPINIVDLDAKKLTIVYPHNTTFVSLDLTKALAVAGVGDPGLVRMDGGSMPVRPGSTIPATTPVPVGPSISLPPPPMPSMPNNPAGASPVMGMPPMPVLPPMPPISGSFRVPELKKTDKTKKIQGFDCALYTVSERGEKFEIWATNDSTLFPFRLIERDFLGRHFGPRMLEDQWAELLRTKNLFPVRVTLRDDGGVEGYRFEVKAITPEKVSDKDGRLFQPPSEYTEIQPLPF